MPKKIGQLKIYDIEELAELMDIQPKTIRAMLADGKLKGRKMARRWYVTEDSLKEYFAIAEAEARQQDKKPA